MYAVIEVGAKQFSVKQGDVIEVQKQPVSRGKDINLKNILLISSDKSVEIGRPYLKEASVKAKVLGEVKGEKTVAYKYRRRKASHWKKGHRQQFTRLEIGEIKVG